MAKMEATLAVLLLLQLAAAAIPADASPPTNCRSKCGNVDVPYPFGIGSRCAISENFMLHCNKTQDGGEKLYGRTMEIVDILLPQAQIRLLNRISSKCYDLTNNIVEVQSWRVLLGRSKTFNSSLNKFTVIGCSTLAYVYVSDVPERNIAHLQTGCLSMCEGPVNLRNGSCDGIGCCQTSIPNDLRYYGVDFPDTLNTSSINSFSLCSYAILMEADSFKFQTSYLTTDAFIKSNGDGRVPVVLDWAIGDGMNCEAAKHNASSYACVSANSECVDAANGLGYTCNCTSGYHGNPYLQNGCQDVDECALEPNKVCEGECRNLNGTYECFCPPGTYSSNPATETCLPDQKLSLGVKFVIGVLGGLNFVLFSIICICFIVQRKKTFAGKDEGETRFI